MASAGRCCPLSQAPCFLRLRSASFGPWVRKPHWALVCEQGAFGSSGALSPDGPGKDNSRERTTAPQPKALPRRCPGFCSASPRGTGAHVPVPLQKKPRICPHVQYLPTLGNHTSHTPMTSGFSDIFSKLKK